MTDIRDFKALRKAVNGCLQDNRILYLLKTYGGRHDLLIKVFGMMRDIQCTKLNDAHETALKQLQNTLDQNVALRLIIKVRFNFLVCTSFHYTCSFRPVHLFSAYEFKYVLVENRLCSARNVFCYESGKGYFCNLKI